MAIVEFENVSRVYKSGEHELRALDGVSFELAEGRMLGIVGPTGGGKTTILSLLLKLYVPERGQLFLGGRDICDIPAACLRKRVGYVPQDGFLFDESIMENVRFFSQASDDEIMRCLDIAGMAQDISRMPEGVKTLCGERGNHLSGGQRQRVSLARALVRKPDILLLDDTLSAVDAATEGRILQSLKSEMAGKSCIVISHRLSAVDQADEILYVDGGKIVERGTHEQLLARGGAYAALYDLQRKKEEA